MDHIENFRCFVYSRIIHNNIHIMQFNLFQNRCLNSEMYIISNTYSKVKHPFILFTYIIICNTSSNNKDKINNNQDHVL
jgi:hypothetical protein